MDHIAMWVGYVFILGSGLAVLACLFLSALNFVGGALWRKLSLTHDLVLLRAEIRKLATAERLWNSELSDKEE